jgi:hypothetical protein
VNDVKFLFQASEQGLNARRDCSGCRPVVAPVYFRIFFEKFVKSAVNGANQDPCSVNIVLFSETSLEGRLFVNLAFVNITVETRPYHKLAPFLRPLSSHCAEHPAKDLPECSDPFDRMACKVKSWLSQLRLEGGTLVPRARDQPGLCVSVPEPNENMTEKTSRARAIGIVIGILVLVIALLWKRLLR